MQHNHKTTWNMASITTNVNFLAQPKAYVPHRLVDNTLLTESVTSLFLV